MLEMQIITPTRRSSPFLDRESSYYVGISNPAELIRINMFVGIKKSLDKSVCFILGK